MDMFLLLRVLIYNTLIEKLLIFQSIKNLYEVIFQILIS